ncbi:bifunctional N(6)-L-threonylcarbamoyladenine synthase/serine/threonine protein kinase [Candidatus Woesearchaeota archaeon]|jgi:N6-L-threonylcarbamoyladenine synthase|nr:bifunctional N(6)-L-threonylcarbamoyladenine synthase/serine/threonine protein kinase [Candidatus Woesearchaeota archaeon]MBT5272288.1 bifunctional N(6)-L-threonylcarbamoyladenine synthase/serine/threonine protein kinase [Candidatus Woesearchaeota archaeon]MBT6040617.1 bifunctional N(6)-L-threonylcarbamoyladenine synthase/serine/threonine protein kinase [Candidatus Woesearchaeota archaeon]MBT6336560.1 bifunctional N(6)-L-threonylcarbamoyladenine synthase/serine/threonine protein kinase [Candi
MIVLGIESTAHTFGVGIVDDSKKRANKVLANVKDSYTTKKGGMIPSKAADHHAEICGKVLRGALEKAGQAKGKEELDMKDVDVIAYSQSPGIGHCLRIGAMAARSLAVKHNKPIVGVNHCIAHLEIGRLVTKAKNPVLLYLSGANTQVIAYEGKKYRIFGETLDMGIGNFLDSFARDLGLGFPGGPVVEKMAKKVKGSDKYVELPYSVKGMDMNFGGMLTNLKQKIKSGKFKKEDLCFSVQETAFAMMVEVAERALAHCDKSELLLGGGVACNKRLQEMCDKMCKARGAKMYVPANEFLVDNAGMIAWLGLLQHKAGDKLKIEKADIKPYIRTDEIEVKWRKD